jgi:hypothetical protein
MNAFDVAQIRFSCSHRKGLVYRTIGLLFVLPALSASAQIYDLLPLGGTGASYAQAIHALGNSYMRKTVGYTRDGAGVDQPTLWGPGGGATALPLPAGAASGAANAFSPDAISFIAGYVQPEDGSTATATLWSVPNTTWVATPLPSPPNAVITSAYSINYSKSIAGFAQFADESYAATVWTPSLGGAYTATLLPQIPLRSNSAATAINAGGDVVGYTERTNLPIESAVWVKSAATYTPKTVIAADTALVTAMNDYGTGTGVYAGDQPLVMVQYEGEFYAGELPTPFGSSGASNFVNSADFIVGNVKDPDTVVSGPEAALWVPTETQWDYVNLDRWLDTTRSADGALWTLTGATGISDDWIVTGNGLYDADGAGPLAAVERAFVLDASPLAPEPSGALVWLLAAAFASRKRFSRASRPCIQ